METQNIQQIPLTKIFINPNSLQCLLSTEQKPISLEEGRTDTAQKKLLPQQGDLNKELLERYKKSFFWGIKDETEDIYWLEWSASLAYLLKLRSSIVQTSPMSVVPVFIATSDVPPQAIATLKSQADKLKTLFSKWSDWEKIQSIYAFRQMHYSDDLLKQALSLSETAFSQFCRLSTLQRAIQKANLSHLAAQTPQLVELLNAVVDSAPLRRWLKWNISTNSIAATNNLSTLIDLLLPKENALAAISPPVLQSIEDVQTFAEINKTKETLHTLLETRDLRRVAEQIDELETQKNVKELQDNLAHLSSKQDKISASTQKMLADVYNEIAKRLPRANSTFSKDENALNLSEPNKIPILKDVQIKNYRALQELHLSQLNRINVIAGINNSGKTSLLEAIYILLIQNDMGALLELQQGRAKLQSLPMRWISDHFPENIQITSGAASTNIQHNKNHNGNALHYLSSIHINAQYENRQKKSSIDLYEKGESLLKMHAPAAHICPVVYSSPFLMLQHQQLMRSYRQSLKIKSEIIAFLAQHIDPKIEDINLTEEVYGATRFKVNYAGEHEPVDLSRFGDGVQRIFYIALQFAAAQDGVLLIDEIENAMHHSLFERFIDFAHRLALRFNVQIFFTTHSRECVDAVFFDAQRAKDCSAYRLVRTTEGNIKALGETGERMHRLIEYFDTDLRD